MANDHHRTIEFVNGDYREIHNSGTYNEATSRSVPNDLLIDLANEIRLLLVKTEKLSPSKTTSERMALAATVMRKIENHPTLRGRILSAFQTGSLRALKQMLDHPAATFILAGLEDWKKNTAKTSTPNQPNALPTMSI